MLAWLALLLDRWPQFKVRPRLTHLLAFRRPGMRFPYVDPIHTESVENEEPLRIVLKSK
jgi:hypothetical protein